MSSDIRNIPLSQIDEPGNPMRMSMDPVSIADLAESIKTSGLINPLTVRSRGERFEVVAGHRRLLACRLVNMAEVPCVVREVSDDEVFSIMGTENLERKDTDPVDDALFLARYIGEDAGKIPAAAKLVNRSINWVQGRLAILSYPDYMIGPVKRGELKLGVANILAEITDEKWREMFVRDAMTQSWTALQAEHQFNLWKGGALDFAIEPPPAPDNLPPVQQSRARAVCEKCGTLAIDPNLRSVFIHVECPSPEAEAQNVPDGSSTPAVATAG